MKSVLITFLFFCFFNGSTTAFKKADVSQETDSLRYYYKIANDPKISIEHPKAFKFYTRLKAENLAQGDTIKSINNLRQIAIMQHNWGDYYTSEASVVEALKLMDNIKRTDEGLDEIRIGLYNQIGRIDRALLKYDSALEYYKKGLEIATMQSHIDAIKNNMALVYRDQGTYALAEAEFLEVYESGLKLGDRVHIARVLNNLGLVRSKMNHPMALTNLEDALNMRLEQNDVIGSYSSYKNLSIYYADRDEDEEALRYANEALRVAREIHQSNYMEDALSLMLGLYKDEQVVMYKHLKDSLDTAKQLQENKNALLKYDVQAEQEKVHVGALLKEQAEKKTLVAQGLMVFVLLLSLLLYVIVRSRHKKEKLQQIYNTEAQISKKVHDEVANGVYQVMSKVQSKPGTMGADLMDDLEHIYTKTRDISKDHSVMEFGGNFEEAINDLLLSYNNEGVGVITKGIKTIPWNRIPNLKKTTIYRVLQELMTNMKKHSQASVAIISFTKTKHTLRIIYKDNGIGCDLKKRVGLQNTESRMVSINGSITFESEINKGFKAIMSI